MLRWTEILLFTICFSIFFAIAIPSANAAAGSSRLAGDDRYLTAIAASQKGWPQGSANVVLTTGENYPDALSAAPLAAKYKAPLLLVGSSGLSPETSAELKRLNATKAYLVGGTGVIPQSVESELAFSGISPVRLAGSDRYDTALAVAQVVGTGQGVFVTSGEKFADTLSAAPIAAEQGMPILLVPGDDFTPSQKAFLTKSKVKKAVLVGSESEISTSIQAYFPSSRRIDGANAYERNVALLQSFKDSLNPSLLYAATGENFPDALTAAALAPTDKCGLVLVQGNEIPSVTKGYLSSKVLDKIVVFGGIGVISHDTESRLQNAAALITDVKNMTVTVEEKQTYNLPKTVTIKTNTGNWEEVPVFWNLTNVSTEKAGTYYYQGTVNGYAGTVGLTLIVKPLPSKADNLTAEVIQGSPYQLPLTVNVTMSDNSLQEYPVQWKTNPTASILGKIGTYTFQGTVEGTSLKATLTLKVSEDAAIKFNDDGLRWVVKFALGRQSSIQPVYRSDVLGITSLDANGHGIRDLTGLEAFTNLKSLDLSSNYLKGANLAPLQKLTNLQSLNLSYNNLEQITALKNLTTLTSLKVNNNAIKDFAPLKGLTRLNSLYLKSNSTEDYSSTRLYYDQLTEKDFIYGS